MLVAYVSIHLKYELIIIVHPMVGWGWHESWLSLMKHSLESLFGPHSNTLSHSLKSYNIWEPSLNWNIKVPLFVLLWPIILPS